MKLATLKSAERDGQLVVVSEDLSRAVAVPDLARNLQQALDSWAACAAGLENVYRQLNQGGMTGSFAFNQADCHSPLPRAFMWCEASAWLSHMERCRKASGRVLPESFYTEPAIHEGGSDTQQAPHDPMLAFDDSWDLDLEAGVCVITDDVPMGASEQECAQHIKLVCLVNDFSLRAIQIPEMAKGMGALQGKPARAYSPVVVTPETLGTAWKNHMLAADLEVHVNEQPLGNLRPDQDGVFNFPQIIKHIARTRAIATGSIIGAGTVSNRNDSAGYGCLYEKRSMEVLCAGEAKTSWLKFGDTVKIEAKSNNKSIFGSIFQKVERVLTS